MKSNLPQQAILSIQSNKLLRNTLHIPVHIITYKKKMSELCQSSFASLNNFQKP